MIQLRGTDPELAQIEARVLNARASTDPLAAQLGTDLDYLIARVRVAEAAVVAGESYAVECRQFLVESFAHTVTAAAREEFRAALAQWRALV